LLDPNVLQEINEVKILLPTEVGVKKYRFKEVTTIIHKKKPRTKTIIREVEIRFSGMENDLWRYQLVVVKQDVIKSNEGSTTIIEKKASIFNELKVYVNHQGTIVSLLNLKQLQDNWQVVREELLSKHEGGALLDFLADTDDWVANEQNILQYITSKEMYGLYFNSCWGYHDLTKPRFEELTITIEKRIQEDRHNQHLQKIFNHDAILKFKTATENKKQESEFKYKNHLLQEAFLEIVTPLTTSKYSVICLK
jgi:hypothetical protein